MQPAHRVREQDLWFSQRFGTPWQSKMSKRLASPLDLKEVEGHLDCNPGNDASHRPRHLSLTLH